MSNIGQAIKWHLEVNGISVYKLAQRLVIAKSTAYQFVSEDANPTWYTLERIAKVIGCSVYDIAGTADKFKRGEL